MLPRHEEAKQRERREPADLLEQQAATKILAHRDAKPVQDPNFNQRQHMEQPHGEQDFEVGEIPKSRHDKVELDLKRREIVSK